MKAKVRTLEEIVGKTKPVKQEKTEEKRTEANEVKKLTTDFVVKGKPKSGRVWKTERKRFSSIIKTKGIRNSFEKKQQLREKLKQVKEASKALKAEKEAEKELKKQRRRDNLKRQEENRLKTEVVQVITNTKKLKKLRKKQLRFIEKRDTTTVG
ncbi:unnamed protein product [Brassicogethes aeneus]|uniref:Coiled-coil domain-containing protein 86 n=1 Tax=Brassicogethes aeneus TaxID=1431903 RepID=A0A9P0FDF8_BRAAE|nr:unnamed protein product [Brassicogethes aeneus]